MPTMSSYFYPRPPQGGRQPVNVLAEQGVQFLSTPSARRATVFGVRLMILMVISIHALRKEGDSSLELAKQMTENFYPRPPQGGRPGQAPASVCGRMISIHALRKEGDAAWRATRPNSEVFLSTPSARRATPNVNENSTAFWHFYPRPPQGGRPPSNMSMLLANKFLSTPSARRATRRMQEPRETRSISIHALRKEGDAHRIRRWDSITQFLSTPSARRATWRLLLYMGKVCNFYPRPPRGGRQDMVGVGVLIPDISIHALREEGDSLLLRCLCVRPADFYPRPPRGGRPPRSLQSIWCHSISIHALREEGDLSLESAPRSL